MTDRFLHEHTAAPGHATNAAREERPVDNLRDDMPPAAKLPPADDTPKWDGPPVGLVESLRAIAAEEDRHDELLTAAADEIDRLRRWNGEAAAVIAGYHYMLGAVARWLAEGLGYPFDVETTIPLHPHMREYVEEAWVVLEGERSNDVEAEIRRNVAQAGGWSS